MSFPSGPPYTYRVLVGLAGLMPRFRVKARDMYYNETAWSTVETALPFESDTVPPAPAPAIVSIVPISPNSIVMESSVAFDAGGVEYYFECVSGGGQDSGWREQTTFVDANLIMPDTQYCYRVKARDKSLNQNETIWSNIVCVTTPMLPDTTAPVPNPMLWSEVIDSNGMDGRPYEYSPTGGTWDYWVVVRADPNTTDSSGSWEFYFECTTDSGFSSGWISFPAGPPYTYRVWVGLSGLSLRFRIKARDMYFNETEWSTEDVALPLP